MKRSAGILPFRKKGSTFEVLLVHPGGPFWKSKDEHAWSVAKGEFTDNELPEAAARREFFEETGFVAGERLIQLEPVKQPGGKVVHVWIAEADFDPADLKSNTFSLEWPPRSGKITEFPEVDKAGWFPLETAFRKIHKGQVPILEQLAEINFFQHSGRV